MADAVAAGDTLSKDCGRKVVLPSSYTGSPRQMFELYQDAMSIVRKYGRPDLFITFTCNPQWEEITSALLLDQKASDRPDLIVRVFRLKLRELLRDLINCHVLGRPLGYVYTIEFQKRGLPHAHILLILCDTATPRDIVEYDRIVCAELPDPVLQPRLHAIVKRCMIHGPCGVAKKSAPCSRDGRCSKRFTKAFSAITTNAEDGYPVYHRRDNGRVVNVSGAQLDNRWVVPYNPYLLLKFNAHINVEICSTVSAVKYLYKYVYKGHDRAIIEFKAVGENVETAEAKSVNEISQYLEGRYVSATEACYRIFAYELHANMPHVLRLALHTKDRQPVYFSEQDDLEDVLSRPVKYTTLTGWFLANQTLPSAKDVTYTNFPDKFVWDKSKYEWKVRVKSHGTMIGRMYAAHPGEGERFYMRMLLNHVTGCTSYVDIRTLADGNVCSSYKEAARRRCLLEDDRELEECLIDAAVSAMPQQMRQLFSTILLFNVPTDPLALWENHKASLAEDFLNRARRCVPDVQLDEHILNSVLLDIQERLQQQGKSLADFPGMPIPRNIRNRYEEPRVIQDELDLCPGDESESVQDNVHLLNADQLRIYYAIMKCVEDHEVGAKVFFIDGPGGTGKTFLYNTLLTKVRGRGEIALAMASSGIAALLLNGGRTVHSRMKVPLSINEHSVCNITKQSCLAQLIQRATLLVWDEAPMTHKHVAECIDRTLRDICSCDFPFGGKVMVFGGDFRQILPVIKREQR